MGVGRAWYAHGRYLSRAGGQREHERGLGFDAESNEVHLGKRLNRWEGDKDPRLWKMIVYPGKGEKLDLRAHARQLVDCVERDLGRRLEWVAIDHHDTSNPHVHVLIRGVDGDGRPFLIPREYVRSGIRHRGQELATRELGLRRERERTRDLGVGAEAQRKIDVVENQQGVRTRAGWPRKPKQTDLGPDRDRILEPPRCTRL